MTEQPVTDLNILSSVTVDLSLALEGTEHSSFH